MKLKEILAKKGAKVWTIKESQVVRDAIRTLVDQKIGSLVVLDDKGGIVGILSERDIVRGCHSNLKGLEKVLVRELMTKKIIIGSPEDETNYIMGIMTQSRIRHIPVVSEGKLRGLVSIGDVVKSVIEDSEYEIHYLKEYIYGPGGQTS